MVKPGHGVLCGSLWYAVVFGHCDDWHELLLGPGPGACICSVFFPGWLLRDQLSVALLAFLLLLLHLFFKKAKSQEWKNYGHTKNKITVVHKL